MNQKKKENNQDSQKPKPDKGESGKTTPQDDICQKAPEWAEHARLQDEDEPCDDGRSGNINR